jgi:hypothetical protein
MLLDYLAGEVKTTWDMTDLQSHARTLARLHQQKFAQHDAIDQFSDAPYDFFHRFDIGVTYWQCHHPYLFDIPIVQHLLRLSITLSVPTPTCLRVFNALRWCTAMPTRSTFCFMAIASAILIGSGQRLATLLKTSP